MITQRYIHLLKRFLLLLIAYTLLRFSFFFYHYSLFNQFSLFEILKSFLLGIRFDISAILILNAPFIIINIFNFNRFKSFERYLFIVFNSLPIIASLVDLELFLFMGKRLSYDLFLITDDILDQLPQLALNFWYFPVVAISVSIGLLHFEKRNSVSEFERFSWRYFLTSLFLLGTTFIGIRGGLQYKSINVQSAFVQGKNELGHLVLNTPYHFLRTLKSKSQNKIKYFATDEEAKSYIEKNRKFMSTFSGVKNANVVIIILESFSLEYLEKGYTPFLNQLKKEGIFFDHHLANGRRSIEALPSLLCGLPSLLNEPISKSIYSGNKFNCFPQVLKNAGYTNYFFHAGARGTMGFESYALANGFDKYFSREDYGDHDFDGAWGVFDLPYLQYVNKNISAMTPPFLASVFTLSSHQPYKIPDEFKGQFPKGKLEIHESIGYVDFALKHFFESAKKTEWYKNTYFIITSDHTQKLESKKFSNLIGRYRVPLLILGPNIHPSTNHKITQHSDIPKTVLDLLEIEGQLPLIGNSVFSEGPGVGLNYADGSKYFLATENKILDLESEHHYDWNTGEMKLNKISNDLLLKAYLQYFINGLINNNLSN